MSMDVCLVLLCFDLLVVWGVCVVVVVFFFVMVVGGGVWLVWVDEFGGVVNLVVVIVLVVGFWGVGVLLLCWLGLCGL